MSGTSLDGIDAVLVDFNGGQLSIVGSWSQPFPKSLRDLLFELASSRMVDADQLTRSNFVLAGEYAEIVGKLLATTGTLPEQISAIGLHGQTIRHLPSPQSIGAETSPVRATLQLGSGAALAALCGIDVISDFRSADMALGGQGAPLVPMFDARFVASASHDRIALNIGGIANLTWLPIEGGPDAIRAFDTGPGNMLIDALTRRYFNQPFDKDGFLAGQGHVEPTFLAELMGDPYFKLPPPKSTGRELFGRVFFDRFVKRIEAGEIEPIDGISTATELTARSIADSLAWLNLRDGDGAKPEIIVSGGGALNTTLLGRLASLSRCSVYPSDRIGIPVQLKEAIAFAFFACAFKKNEIIHLPHTTGATRPILLGILSRG